MFSHFSPYNRNREHVFRLKTISLKARRQQKGKLVRLHAQNSRSLLLVHIPTREHYDVRACIFPFGFSQVRARHSSRRKIAHYLRHSAHLKSNQARMTNICVRATSSVSKQANRNTQQRQIEWVHTRFPGVKQTLSSGGRRHSHENYVCVRRSYLPTRRTTELIMQQRQSGRGAV